jgi:hypothetical protein
MLNADVLPVKALLLTAAMHVRTAPLLRAASRCNQTTEYPMQSAGGCAVTKHAPARWQTCLNGRD